MSQSEDNSNAQACSIPVRNLWLLMLYASKLRIGRKAYTDFEENPADIPKLVAEILAKVTAKRLERSLHFHYRAKKEILNRVRGRIDLFATERLQLLERGKIFCSFFEMNVNAPRYRYVCKALEKIAAIVDESDLKNRCRALAQNLKQLGVNGPAPGDSEVLRIRYSHYDKDDKTMIDTAYIALRLALLNEEAGRQIFFIQIATRNIGYGTCLKKL